MTRFTVDNQNRLIFYDNPVGYAVPEERRAVADPIFRCEELEQGLASHRLTTQWEDGLFERLISGKGPLTEQGELLKHCRIWQLHAGTSIAARFIDLKKRMELFGEPERQDYEVVYDGQPGTNDLEEIYELFSTGEVENYQGRRLAMSDVVELYDRNGSAFFYCDRTRFQPIKFE